MSISTPQAAPGCMNGAHVKQQLWVIVDYMKLGSLLVTSLIRAPGKQHTTLKNGSGQQIGPSVYLSERSHLLLSPIMFSQLHWLKDQSHKSNVTWEDRIDCIYH